MNTTLGGSSEFNNVSLRDKGTRSMNARRDDWAMRSISSPCAAFEPIVIVLIRIGCDITRDNNVP